MTMQGRLCASILCLEAIVLGLTTPVLITVAQVPKASALWIGLGLCVACFVVAGMLRRPWALWLGWAIQAAALALAVKIPTMAFLGAIFLALWVTAYLLGAKIDRERAEWERTGQYPGRPPEGTP